MLPIDPVQKLVVLEEIRVLKARYFRYVDTKNWDGFSGLFTVDAQFDITADVPGLVLTGRDAIVGAASAPLRHTVTVHHGHCPEINIVAADEATAIWVMEDRIFWDEKAVDIPFISLHGFGHYHESYRQIDGCWFISTLKLTRLMVKRVVRAE